jgi:hypothetical protein
MTEFFAINVDRFAGPGQKQLQVFGASVDKKMQIAWAAPSVKSVTMLERVQHLITPMVRYHFNDIVVGGKGYRGYRRTVANIAEASWHWQVDVPCPTGRSDERRLPIRCRGGVFQGERSVSPAYGCSIVGGVPQEGMMYVGRRLSTAMLCST